MAIKDSEVGAVYRVLVGVQRESDPWPAALFWGGLFSRQQLGERYGCSLSIQCLRGNPIPTVCKGDLWEAAGINSFRDEWTIKE